MGTGLNPRDNFELTKEDNLYYVTIRNFKDGQLFLDENCDRISQEAWNIIQLRSDLHKGDIIFASISKDGQAYILDDEPENWNINESVFCIRINREYYHDKYFYYHLIDTGYYSDLRMDATGSTFQSIKQNKLKKSRMVLPPITEQKLISSYLDTQCAHIDNIIEKTKASIEEYKKLKQAVITQAVTKGVRGDRPMKDSGIEWIGEIPVEWQIGKAKHYVTITNGCDPKLEGDIPVYGSGAKSFKTCGEYKKAPCVLIGRKGATLHIPHYIDHDYWNVDTAFDVKTRNGFILKYYYYLAVCFDYKFYISQTTLPGMTQTNYENMFIPCPLIIEQQEIAAYLDKKCAEIDAIIAKKQQFITEMENYKKSMIYEYVTGKKEVL